MQTTEFLLGELGVDAAAEAVYLCLLDEPVATVAEVTRRTALPGRRVGAACAALEARGLISRSPGRPTRYVPAQPDVAVEALVARQREGLERARRGSAALLARYRRGVGSSTRSEEFVEVIAGREAIAQRFRQMQSTVAEELLVFDKPPYVVDPPANASTEDEVLERGVSVRVIYDTSALVPGQLDVLPGLAAKGEQARVVSDLPMKLVIADRRLGLVPLRQGEPGLEGRLLIHESPLLDALIMLFEAVWERATPLRQARTRRHAVAADTPVAADDRTLLLFLAAGLKDEAIARHLNVTERTVARRMQRLFLGMGAQTRFQAGLTAARRGWLE